MHKLGLIGCFILMFCSGVSFAARPLTVEITNNSGTDLKLKVAEFRHLDVKAIRNLEDQTIYAGETHIFTFDRTDDPAELSVLFRAAGTEQEVSGYDVGEWEYVEYDVTPQTAFVVETCHHVLDKAPFVIDCSGNNSFVSPAATLNINYDNS